MIIDESHLLKLIKGLQNFQKTGANISIAPSEKDAEKHPSGSVDPFLSDVLAQSFIREQKILREIYRDKPLRPIGAKINKYSPLSFSLDLTVSKNKPYFFEFFHLCEKHQCIFHPAAIPFLLRKNMPYRIKAEILSRVDIETMELIESQFELNQYWVDKSIADLDENQPVKLWWYFQKRKVAPEVLSSQAWKWLSLKQKKEILQSSGPEENLNISSGIPIQFTSNSGKYNSLLLACALTNPKFYLNSDLVEFLRSYVKKPHQNILPASLEELKGIFPFSISHWVSFLLASTPPSYWLDDECYSELQKWDFSLLTQEIYRSMLESALKFNHEKLFLLMAQRSPGPKIVKCLEEISRHNPAIRVSSVFFHRVSGAMLSETPIFHYFLIIDLLGNLYDGFVSNEISKAILKKLKDPEYKLLQSEKGINSGGHLCEKLAYSANPLLLKTLQLMPGEFVFHPLEGSFEKILTCWRYRLEMRKAFIK